MRSVILGVLMAFVSAFLHAAPIPSSASGQYATPDRVCRVELARAGTNHVDVDLLCITDAGVPTYSRTRIEAWAGRCPGDAYTASVFQLSGPSPAAGFVALDAADATGLHVRVGPDAGTLHNGGGQSQTWALIRQVVSASPYTCGSRAPSQSLLDNCRLNPRAPWCGR